MYAQICAAVFDVGIGHAWPWEIDELGPFAALQLSYTRALEEIHPSRKPQLLIVDGSNRVVSWDGVQKVVPKADVNHIQVSAASIVAKFFRDNLMESYAMDRRRKGLADYGWLENKGYGTDQHERDIKAHGLLIDESNLEQYIHRRRYCRKFLVSK